MFTSPIQKAKLRHFMPLCLFSIAQRYMHSLHTWSCTTIPSFFPDHLPDWN